MRCGSLLVALLLTAASAWGGTTYYVDPGSGNNANIGTVPGSPWLNPPGTRRADNVDFWSTTWGAISTSAKVQCGDRILLRGGRTQASAQGGAWLIDSSYYSNCSAAAPITIKVANASEWAGSTGALILDGTNVTPTYNAVTGFDDHQALIIVADRGYISILGDGASQRLIVQDSTKWAVNVHCHNCTNAGFRGAWWELRNGSSGGFNIGGYTDWQVSNSVAHDLHRGGWQAGLSNDVAVDRGAFVDDEVYASGSATDQAGTDDGFFFTGGRGMWCVRCTAHDNNQRGFNTGVIIDNANVPFRYRFRDLIAYNNGLACGAGVSCAGAGIGVSGNDSAAAATIKNVVNRAILFHNTESGTWNYGTAFLELWHAVFYRTNTAGNAGQRGSIRWDVRGQQLAIFNSVDQKRPNFKAFATNDSGVGNVQNLTPVVGNSCFRSDAADSEALGFTPPGAGTYAAPPSWIGATNRTQRTTCDPKFAVLNDDTYLANDFRPTADSSLIDNGRFFMHATNAGTAARTMTVTGNGGSNDPRDFFIEPASYLGAIGDTVQIENCTLPASCRVTIASMTATSITFVENASWQNGADIHLPWVGVAPDIGFYEASSGQTTTTATTTTTTTTTLAGSCLTQAGTLVTLSGQYPNGYQNTALTASSKVDGRAGVFFDSEALLKPSGPYRLGQADGICVAGGVVIGNYPRDPGWDYMHDNARNHGGLQLRSANAKAEGQWIDNVEDGIRLESTAENFSIRGVELTDIHDDCFDDHEKKGGTFDDILADGCYVGLSTRDTIGDASCKVVTLKNSLIRLKPWTCPDVGEVDPGHGGFFKWNSDTGGACHPSTSPNLILTGNLFYAQQTTRSENAQGVGIPNSVWATMQECHDNVVVWRGPGAFPAPTQGLDPAGSGRPCLTVTTDQTVWDNAVAAWRAAHPHPSPPVGLKSVGGGRYGGGRL